MRPPSHPERLLAALLGVSIAVVLVLFLDSHRFHRQVLRGVRVAGQNVGGFSPSRLDEFIDDLETQYRSRSVRIALPDGGFSAPGASFGLRINRPQLRYAALHAGRGGGFAGYLGSFVREHRVPVPVTVNRATIDRTLRRIEGSARRNPSEPKLVVEGRKFVVVQGRDGFGVSADAVAEAIPSLAARSMPITVAANRVALPVTYTNDDLARLVDEATAKTSNGLRIALGERIETITTDQLRSWVVPMVRNRRAILTLDPELTLRGVRRLMSGVGQPAIEARLVVSDDGSIAPIPSQVGLACCAPDAVDKIEAAMGQPVDAAPVELALIKTPPRLSTEAVMAMGVKEEIGEFTTRHPCCESRVKNIHRLADIIRGRVIPPGGLFSINAVVGERTKAKGFFAAPSIVDGVHEDSIGGGISQFATTLFNASFFGGLDLVQYQSHSVYIRRYPFGREATLGFPNPDLRIRNSTPYGVMIWPVYNRSSLTVKLYSTPYVKGDVADQRIEKRGLCKIVHTSRLRVYRDGTTKTDEVRAAYRPGEGVNCNGRPTAGATTTTIKPKPRPSVPRESSSAATPPTTAKRHSTTIASEPAPERTEPPATRAAEPEPEKPAPETPTPEPVTEPPAPVEVAAPPVSAVQPAEH